MGHPENSAVTGKDGSGAGPTGGAPLSPVRAFLLLMALLVLAGVILLLTTRPERAEPIRMERSQAAGETGAPQENPESRPEGHLTKAKAKDIFRELNEAVLKAYRKRDASLIPEIWTTNSPVRSTARREIHQLLQDSVLVRTRFTTKQLSVESITSSRIQLVQVVVIDPRFVTESGKEVTSSDVRDRDTVKWKLRKEDGRWLIHRALVLDRDRLDPDD